MNTMLQGLNDNTNYAHTDNGALVRESTNSTLLDYFSKAGALRENTELSVNMFDSAYSENPQLAVKALFYFRDVRGGQGERNNFRAQLLHLTKLSKSTVRNNLPIIAEFGRWDDILCLLDTPLKDDVVKLIKNQLLDDIQNLKDNNEISLLAKWLPSVGSGKISTKLAKQVSKLLKLSNHEYRKILSTLRESLNIVERKMSRGLWHEIDYKTVPSNAMMQYRKAFARHDEVRFNKYIEDVNSGETTINSSTLYPYEIIAKCRDYRKTENPDLLNAQWNALPNFVSGEPENAIAVVDTSGSMMGDPINVAVSLGIYLGERAKGDYKDHFITFSEDPKLQKITGTGIVQKVRNLSNANWSMNTNIEAVFDLILQVGIDKKLSQSDMIDKVYIISDMQFDSCTGRLADQTLFTHIANKFNSYGFIMPKLVFWNVRASAGNTPMSMDDRGFQNVSGLSPSILKYIMGGEFKDAYSLMVDVLESDRYASVVV